MLFVDFGTDRYYNMFRRYRSAAKCYVYLSDVSIREIKGTDGEFSNTWEPAFRHSKWFVYSRLVTSSCPLRFELLPL